MTNNNNESLKQQALEDALGEFITIESRVSKIIAELNKILTELSKILAALKYSDDPERKIEENKRNINLINLKLFGSVAILLIASILIIKSVATNAVESAVKIITTQSQSKIENCGGHQCVAIQPPPGGGGDGWTGYIKTISSKNGEQKKIIMAVLLDKNNEPINF